MGPRLERRCEGGVYFWTDPDLKSRADIVVAFSERGGGESAPPFESLNLAQHVGDDPVAVDANRDALFRALGLPHLRGRVVTAEQVHGSVAAVARDEHACAGAYGARPETPPLPATDSLVTVETALPLLLLFADCVPVVFAAEGPRRGIAVAHAGWRGAAAGVHVTAAEALFEETGCGPDEVCVYVGPHIGPCHYQVGSEVLAQFGRDSATIASAQGRLDLGAIVSADLERIGVPTDRIAALARCTAEHTDEFYSYRAERVTGRHGALAVILGDRQ